MNSNTQIKERPILFSAPMVKAILEGRKTQTRRAVKIQPDFNVEAFSIQFEDSRAKAVFQELSKCRGISVACPYGQPGDRLWVRETFCWPEDYSTPIYRADGEELPPMEVWHPSIHMPRAASRILLEITDVRVERLWDILAEDAIAEGVQKAFGPNWVNYADENYTCGNPSASFLSLWEKINSPESLAKNPFVWVITFKKI